MSPYDIDFTDKGPVAPQTAEVRSHILGNWQTAFDNKLNPDEATPQGQAVTSETAMVQDKNNKLLFLANQFDPYINEGIWQDAIGRIYFLDRHPARPTVVYCLCTGIAGVPIPGLDTSLTPAIVQDDMERQFVCTRSGKIGPSGTVLLPFACVTPGPLVVAAHTVTGIVTTIPGFDTVDNPEAGITGQSQESRIAFEERRRRSVAKNARSVLGAVYGEIFDLEGVIDVLCSQNRTGETVTLQGYDLKPHSLYAAVLGGQDAEIARAIYNSNSGGSDYNGNTSFIYTDPVTGAIEDVFFVRPEMVGLAVQVRYRPTTGTPADVEESIKAAIVADFNGEFIPPGEDEPANSRVGIAQTTYASRFYCPVMHSGVTNLLSIKVALAGDAPEWGESVELRLDQAPFLTVENVFIVDASRTGGGNG